MAAQRRGAHATHDTRTLSKERIPAQIGVEKAGRIGHPRLVVQQSGAAIAHGMRWSRMQP